MIPVKAVIFDLDGTLVDTMTLLPRIYCDTISECANIDLSAADVVAQWHRGTADAVLGHFFGRPATSEELARFRDRVHDTVHEVRPFPGIASMLSTLDAAGYRLGLFTSATRRMTDRTLQQTKLGCFFAATLCGDETPAPKPHSQGLLSVCRQLGAEMAAATYVGDSAVDLRCAQNAGILGIHAHWGGPADCPSVDSTGGDRGLACARDPAAVPRRLRALAAAGT